MWLGFDMHITFHSQPDNPRDSFAVIIRLSKSTHRQLTSPILEKFKNNITQHLNTTTKTTTTTTTKTTTTTTTTTSTSITIVLGVP